MLKFLHFLIGHRWSEWLESVLSRCAYEGERWETRDCICGAHEERDL